MFDKGATSPPFVIAEVRAAYRFHAHLTAEGGDTPLRGITDLRFQAVDIGCVAVAKPVGTNAVQHEIILVCAPRKAMFDRGRFYLPASCCADVSRRRVFPLVGELVRVEGAGAELLVLPAARKV